MVGCLPCSASPPVPFTSTTVFLCPTVCRILAAQKINVREKTTKSALSVRLRRKIVADSLLVSPKTLAKGNHFPSNPRPESYLWRRSKIYRFFDASGVDMIRVSLSHVYVSHNTPYLFHLLQAPLPPPAPHFTHGKGRRESFPAVEHPALVGGHRFFRRKHARVPGSLVPPPLCERPQTPWCGFGTPRHYYWQGQRRTWVTYLLTRHIGEHRPSFFSLVF